MTGRTFISKLSLSIKGQAQRFLKNQNGGVAIFLAFAIIPLIGFVGIATDATRSYMVKSRLSSAIDAAGLAGGQSFFKPTRDADINMFFDANFPANYMGATVNGPDIKADEENETLTLNASATVPMVFMQLFGYQSVTVNAFAEITREMQALDVVIAMDMSGSMGNSLGDGTRMSAARQAATDLVDILYGDDTSKDHLNIGVVPWNGKVNVTLDGTGYDPANLTATNIGSFINPISNHNQTSVYYAGNSPVPLLFEPDSAWKGCVYSRYIDDGFEDTNADTLLPPVDTGAKEWLAWEPIGKEGEPLNGDGSEVKIVQAKSAKNYDDTISITFDSPPKPGNVLIAVGSRRGGSTYNIPIQWKNLLTFNANSGGDIRRMRFMAHEVEPGENTVTLVANEAKHQALTVMEVEGLDYKDLLIAKRTTDMTHSTGKSLNLKPVNVNKDGALLVAGGAFEDDDLGDFSWSNGFTQVADIEQQDGPDEDLTHGVATRVVNSNGSYGTIFKAQTGAPEERWGAILALKAAGVCTGSVTGGECTPCLGHGITPLNNSKTTVLAAINDLTTPVGTTNIPQGLGWAWRVLKPEDPFNEAVVDPDYTRQQAIVLLTDGENFGGNGDGYKTVFGYGSAAQEGMNERLKKLAANVKADGVVLYVIQFANEGTELQALLKDIASGPKSPFYHYAPDQAALKEVFREIANHLSELRLSR